MVWVRVLRFTVLGSLLTPLQGCFWVMLTVSSPAHPSPLRCFLQVQEKCDYDLVMPLALLFYYAVLCVSPLHVASPRPHGTATGAFCLKGPGLL